MAIRAARRSVSVARSVVSRKDRVMCSECLQSFLYQRTAIKRVSHTRLINSLETARTITTDSRHNAVKQSFSVLYGRNNEYCSEILINSFLV